MKIRTVAIMLALTVCTASATTVTWEFPRTGSCHEGIPFSDGKTGVLVWGGGETVNLTVGRGDLWEHRGGQKWLATHTYSNIMAGVARNDKDYLKELTKRTPKEGEPRTPFMLPLGRVVVTVPGATLTHGSLDPFTGLGRIEFLKDGMTKTAEIAMAKKDRAFAIRFPDGVHFSAKAIPAMTWPKVREKLLPLGYADAVPSDAGFTWEIPGDPSVTLKWKKKGGELFVQTARGADGIAVPEDFAAVADASREHWARFWAEGARVRVPDPVIQRIYDYGMYKFGAMTDPDGIPAGLQGQWLEDDKLVPWNGDYHLNINVQECYSPAYRGGHFAHLKPLFRMIRTWWPKMRENARLFVGVEDGFLVPTAVDDRGTVLSCNWIFMMDHACTAWTAKMMYDYVKYSGDVAFLRSDAYPFMVGAMKVYRRMLAEDEGGKLMMPCGPSPEWGREDAQSFAGKNPAFQLAAVHRLARDLGEAAKTLGKAPDPMWADVDRRLPHYERAPKRPEGYYDDGILLFKGEPLSANHRHHSHMAGYWPFDTIDMSDPVNREVTNLTYWNWSCRGMGFWAGWSMPWASILHTHVGNRDAAVDVLHLWDRYFCNEGHGSRHDTLRPGLFGMRRGSNYCTPGVIGDAPGEEIMQMDGQCCVATAVLELLVHEVNGKVGYFKGCPDAWKEVSFENIALSDGRRVDGRRVEGRTTVWTR